MTEASIRTEGLIKRYGETVALAGLDLEVPQGEMFGFLGPNGAGKTTTCRILTTLTRPSAGRALVSGFDVVRQPVKAKQGMGLVPQYLNLEGELTVYENLKLHGMLHGMSPAWCRRRIEAMLGFAGLFERRDHRTKQLSGGLKRRLMIARALLHEPKVLFLDEPTVGLDAHSRRRVWDLIRDCHRQGVTVFLTTHYIEEAENLCERVAIIDQGSLIALDSPRNLLASTGRVVVERIDGTPGEPLFFEHRRQAAEFVAGREGNFVIRNSNLEDVFIRLTGRRVTP